MIRLRRDDGFTLPELLISSALLGLVLLTVGGVMIASMTAERDVHNVTSAASAGQFVSRTIERTVTNSATPLSVTAVGDDLLLRARTAGSGDPVVWSCTGFYYSAEHGTIRSTTSPTSLGTVTAASTLSWTLLAEDIVALPDTTTPDPDDVVPVFAIAASGGVTLNFAVDAGTSQDVVFTTTISSRTNVSGGSPCY